METQQSGNPGRHMWPRSYQQVLQGCLEARTEGKENHRQINNSCSPTQKETQEKKSGTTGLGSVRLQFIYIHFTYILYFISFL